MSTDTTPITTSTNDQDSPRHDPYVGTYELTVPGRFCGPPEMGNGGWVAGSLARYLPNGAVQVTLRSPAPLDRPLTVRVRGDAVQLVDGDTLCAEAVAAAGLDGHPPSPVTVEDASTAAAGFVGHGQHPFPTCFVCGPERDAGDALRIFTGPVAARPGVVASTWTPDASLVEPGSTGLVRTEAIWAALDCPTGWAHYEPGGVALLGRHTVELLRPVVANETYVVVAERVRVDGRKLHATAALYDSDGSLHAAAHALWITLA